jgi:undecaprenyl-diphosphatase
MEMSSSPSQSTLLMFSILFLACFLLVALFRGSFGTVNLEVNMWAASIQVDFFTVLAKGISFALDATVLGATSIVLAVILFIKKRGRYGVLLLGAMAGDVLLVQMCKTLIASPRPINEILAESGYSFPSGHVTGSVVFFGVLTYFAWTHWSSVQVKASTAGLYVAMVAIVGFDRIYLNVHWLSDVTSAVFLGAFWLILSIFLFKNLLQTRRVQRFSLPNAKQ